MYLELKYPEFQHAFSCKSEKLIQLAASVFWNFFQCWYYIFFQSIEKE